MTDTTGIDGVDSPMPAKQKKLEHNALTVYNLSQEDLKKKFRGGRTVEEKKKKFRGGRTVEEKKNKYEAQNRWREKNLKKYTLYFRTDSDGEIIDLLDYSGREKTNVIRKALRQYIKKGR